MKYNSEKGLFDHVGKNLHQIITPQFNYCGQNMLSGEFPKNSSISNWDPNKDSPT